MSTLRNQSNGALNNLRFFLLLFVVLTTGCTSADLPGRTSQPTMKPQAFPITIKVHGGAAAGMSDSMLARVVRLGVQQGCGNGPSGKASVVADPELFMEWSFERVSLRPLVMVNVSLFSRGHLLSSTFEQILSPNAEPTAAFEYAIASVTCILYRKAGSLDPPRTGTANNDLNG